MSKIKVLVVEDNVIIADYFKLYINGSDHYELAGCVKNADMAPMYCEGG